MKRKNLIKLLVDTIYRDNIYLITPIIDWDLMDIVNKHFRDNYNKVLPVLLKWQEKEYISLINDDNVIFIFSDRFYWKNKFCDKSCVTCNFTAIFAFGNTDFA